MKIGILKTDTVRPKWVGDHGEYPDMFAALLGGVDPSLEFVTYDVEHGVYPTDVNEVDAYLITGSKSSVYDDFDWIPPLKAFVKEIFTAGKKILGICFGHQLVAASLGGKVEKAVQGWGVGTHTHTFTETPDWHDGDKELAIHVIHQDQVITPAEGASTLAGSDFCPNAVCQIGDQVLTFQGHPEFSREYVELILNFRRERLGEDTFVKGMASLEQKPQSDRVARWLVEFLKGASKNALFPR